MVGSRPEEEKASKGGGMVACLGTLHTARAGRVGYLAFFGGDLRSCRSCVGTDIAGKRLPSL